MHYIVTHPILPFQSSTFSTAKYTGKPKIAIQPTSILHKSCAEDIGYYMFAAQILYSLHPRAHVTTKKGRRSFVVDRYSFLLFTSGSSFWWKFRLLLLLAKTFRSSIPSLLVVICSFSADSVLFFCRSRSVCIYIPTGEVWRRELLLSIADQNYGSHDPPVLNQPCIHYLCMKRQSAFTSLASVLQSIKSQTTVET